MLNSTTPTPPLGNPSAKKRKYDQLDPPSPPLPASGSVLYVALYALPPPKRRGGVLNYRWAFLLAQDDKPETRGRQYLVREASPRIDPSDGAGDSKGLGIMGQDFEELGLEQQERRFDGLLATHPSSEDKDTQKLSAWEFEIQDVCMQASGETRVRIQLPRVRDVETFEALIKDAFLKSDGTRGVDRNHVMWMGDVWNAMIEAGDVIGVGGLKSEPISWKMVRKTAMGFVQAQESEGRLDERNLTLRVPTWGLLKRQLLVS